MVIFFTSKYSTMLSQGFGSVSDCLLGLVSTFLAKIAPAQSTKIAQNNISPTDVAMTSGCRFWVYFKVLEKYAPRTRSVAKTNCPTTARYWQLILTELAQSFRTDDSKLCGCARGSTFSTYFFENWTFSYNCRLNYAPPIASVLPF